MLTTILIIILILMLVGALPGISGHGWGYGPSGLVTILLVVLLILVLTGRL